MPFVDFKFRQSHHVVIAETDYVNPDSEEDKLKVYICVPNTVFNEQKLQEKFGQFNTYKVNFVNDIKSFVLAHNLDALKKKVEASNNTLRFKLNNVAVELTRGEDFYLSAEEHSKAHK